MPRPASRARARALVSSSRTTSVAPSPHGSATASGAPRVVAIGGGTGLSTLLRGLRGHVASGEIAALTGIVTVADDGGSSGRLRRDFGVLPPGDIRNCLAALADEEDLLTRLFQYRFDAGEGLAGHPFGNLFLTALTDLTGDFSQAILAAERILSVRGRILPSTLADVRLRARGASGHWHEGESAVGRAGEPFDRLALVPASAPAFPPALAALAEADLIVLGPGSLFTSLLPNLLIDDLRAALARRRAPAVLPLNLMTQPGETDGLDAVGHLAAIERHAGEGLIDIVLVHGGEIPESRLAAYRASGAEPVVVARGALERRGVAVVEADLLAPGDLLVRHDPARLASAVLASRRC